MEHTGSYSESYLDVRGGNSKDQSPREDHKLHPLNLVWALCQIDISPKHSCCSRVHSIVDCRVNALHQAHHCFEMSAH